MEQYWNHTMIRRKILHLLKNNGIPAAKSWADKHMGGAAAFLDLVPRFEKKGVENGEA